jgi:hypothetical protein
MREIEKYKAAFKDGEDFDIEAIRPIIDSMSRSPSKYKLQFLLFISRGDPLDSIRGWHRHGFEPKINKMADFAEIDLKRTIERSSLEGGLRRLSGSFGLWRVAESDIWVAFTSDSPDFFNNGLVSFIESYRPSFTRMFLNSDELKDVFIAVEKRLSCDIWVNKAIVYPHGKRARIDFNKRPYLEVFNSPDLEDRYVDKIDFSLRKDGRVLFHGFISRDCICYYLSGKVEYLFNCIIPSMITRGERKRHGFKNVERHSGQGDVRPLTISFDRDLLTDRIHNEVLARAVSSIQRSAIAVYHMNPYLHLSLTDFIDGSTMDIVSTSASEVSIYPGYNCSFYSLTRVSEEISKNFYEGKIEEATPHRYGLADFIGA